MGPGRYRLRPTILDRTIASFRIGEGRRASHLPQFISGYPCASGWISLCPFHSPCRGNLADGNPKNHPGALPRSETPTYPHKRRRTPNRSVARRGQRRRFSGSSAWRSSTTSCRQGFPPQAKEQICANGEAVSAGWSLRSGRILKRQTTRFSSRNSDFWVPNITTCAV